MLNPDGQSSRVEDKVLTINIKPGWKSGTKITFPKEGDQHPGRVPADIVFVIKDKPHPKFKVIQLTLQLRFAGKTCYSFMVHSNLKVTVNYIAFSARRSRYTIYTQTVA